MTRRHLATAAWLSVATLAFGLGWMLRPVPESSASPSSGEERLVGKASVEPSTPAAKDGSGGGAEAGAGEAGDAGEASSGSNSLLVESVRVLSRAGIEELGKKFKTDLDPVARRLAFARLLEGLTVENAKEIREQIAHLRPDSSEFIEFHYAWGKIGGVDAVIHGAETDKPDMVATLAGWASADPGAAMRWFGNLEEQSNENFANREHLKRGMVHGLSNTDTDMATRFVFELAAAGDKQAEGMIGIVSGNVLRAGGPEGAAAWAGNLPSGNLRTTAMAKVAHAYAQQNPEAAAAWAGQLGKEDRSGWVVGAITSQWARRDGEAAVGWLESLGDSPGRAEAYRVAFEGWTDKNPAAASEYLAEMPQSPARDQAISGLVNRHRWEDPVASIVWAETISSEKARLEALTRAGQAWTRRDPAAAAEWAASSGLPPKLQQEVINPPRTRGK